MHLSTRPLLHSSRLSRVCGALSYSVTVSFVSFFPSNTCYPTYWMHNSPDYSLVNSFIHSSFYCVHTSPQGGAEANSINKHSLSTMGRCSLRAEFLVNDSSIDCNGITLPARDALEGWLLSSPVTRTFSTMHLSRPRQVSSSPADYDGYLSPNTLNRLTKACQATSRKLQHRLSISSDSSDPGMMYDPFSSSGSDTSFEEPLSRNHSKADLASLREENETWDLYWTPIKESPLQLCVDAYMSPLGREPNLSPCNRNFASSNLSSFNTPDSPRPLKRSNSRRAPRRMNQSSPSSLSPHPRATYSPFPTCTATVPEPTSCPDPSLESDSHPTDPQHTQHKSWPTRTTSNLPHRARSPLRTRAHTTPSTPSNFTPTYPSNLSTCTTLDYQSPRSSSPCTSSSSALYMRSPLSPSLLLAMDIGNETSVWEDDDEDEGVGGLVGSLRSRLHIKSLSAQEEKEGMFGVQPRQVKKRMKRSLSEVVKGVFRLKKKGGTL